MDSSNGSPHRESDEARSIRKAAERCKRFAERALQRVSEGRELWKIEREQKLIVDIQHPPERSCNTNTAPSAIGTDLHMTTSANKDKSQVAHRAMQRSFESTNRYAMDSKSVRMQFLDFNLQLHNHIVTTVQLKEKKNEEQPRPRGCRKCNDSNGKKTQLPEGKQDVLLQAQLLKEKQ